jgi:hypothetical protein
MENVANSAARPIEAGNSMKQILLILAIIVDLEFTAKAQQASDPIWGAAGYVAYLEQILGNDFRE